LVAIKLIKSDSAWEREDYPHCSERPIQEIAAMQYLEKRIAQMDEHDHGEVCVDPISSIEDTWNRKMRIIRNYHVITSLDVLSCDKNMYIIMPYCDGGELLQLLNGRDRAFEEEEARKVLKQILKGLETLQKVEICHRDISIENIMTIGDDVALLIDFGVAMRIPYTRDSSGKRHRCLINSGGRPFGKELYLSPEYVADYDGHALDLWALGVVLYMMVLKRYLWSNPMETDVVFSRISSGEFATIYENLKNRNEVPEISSDLVDLIQNLFLKEPRQRFTLEQVRAHRWMIPF
jgi:serine/threonine protein kinase